MGLKIPAPRDFGTFPTNVKDYTLSLHKLVSYFKNSSTDSSRDSKYNFSEPMVFWTFTMHASKVRLKTSISFTCKYWSSWSSPPSSPSASAESSGYCLHSEERAINALSTPKSQRSVPCSYNHVGKIAHTLILSSIDLTVWHPP